ncbi:hypothetical protein BJ165DRAFT_1437025 [Panaeolus papilionaceus]|nr:hypothetical protein BJ165DRAFT_1437025 [Panaeolus papilionaceus]
MSAIGHDHLQPIGDSLFEQALRYICVSSTVILVYDTILTLDLEIAYVWRSRWSLMKFLYFLTRYSAFIDTPPLLTFYLAPNMGTEQCSRLHMGQQWLFGLGVGSAQGILVLRTIALYDHDRNLRSYICLFLFLVYTPVTLILVFWANAAKFGPTPPGIHGCHIKGKNYILFTAYIALALTETVLVVLTVRQVLRKFGHFWRDEEKSSYSLIRTFNRDGVLFFICLFGEKSPNTHTLWYCHRKRSVSTRLNMSETSKMPDKA